MINADCAVLDVPVGQGNAAVRRVFAGAVDPFPADQGGRIFIPRYGMYTRKMPGARGLRGSP
jgi:hypothetical protein